MPLYEFKCKNCGNVIEFLTNGEQKIPEKCPNCNSSVFEKLFSAFAVGDPSSSKGAPKPECAGCSTGACPFAGK